MLKKFERIALVRIKETCVDFYTFLRVKRIRRKNNRFAKRNTVSHISSEQRRECIAYFGKYYKVNTAFHDFYTEKTGVFDVRYLPDDCYYAHVDRFFNNWTHADVLDNKCFYERMFGEVCAQPGIFAYRMNQFWYNDKMERVDYSALLDKIQNEDEFVIKKATGSCGGHGVFFVDNKHGDICEEFKKAVASISSDIVIQYPIKQHAVLSAIHPESVNTIRVMSLLRKNEVKICSSVLRMGVGGNKVDNASSGGIVCGIDENGRLREKAFTPKGKVFMTHPTTGISFPDYTVPAFDKIKEAVKKLQVLIPHFRMVSWDFSVNEKGEPVLIEANLMYGELEFHQLCNGPIFGDDTEEILKEVFGK